VVMEPGLGLGGYVMASFVAGLGWQIGWPTIILTGKRCWLVHHW
jgi:hypothetical protein